MLKSMALMENGERLKWLQSLAVFVFRKTASLLADVVAVDPGVVLLPVLCFEEHVLIVFARDHAHALGHRFRLWLWLFRRGQKRVNRLVGNWRRRFSFRFLIKLRERFRGGRLQQFRPKLRE